MYTLQQHAMIAIYDYLLQQSLLESILLLEMIENLPLPMQVKTQFLKFLIDSDVYTNHLHRCWFVATRWALQSWRRVNRAVMGRTIDDGNSSGVPTLRQIASMAFYRSHCYENLADAERHNLPMGLLVDLYAYVMYNTNGPIDPNITPFSI